MHQEGKGHSPEDAMCDRATVLKGAIHVETVAIVSDSRREISTSRGEGFSLSLQASRLHFIPQEAIRHTTDMQHLNFRPMLLDSLKGYT